ncbi:MFS transporter [Desulfococcaceae bacterium HSG9]|nr:MFS transporter [Desulfococcaceae bacterium HSG9]
MDENRQSKVRWIIGGQYFLYFGVMGIFLPYFNLYCHRIGLSGSQIGALSALKSLMMVVTPLLWAMLADRYQIRRPIYIFCLMVSTASWGLYFLTTAYAYMAAITIFYGIFHAPVISFLEAFTMDILGAKKKSYGKIRVWGSVAFISVTLIMGQLIDLFDVSIILSLIFAGGMIQTLAAFKVPSVKIGERASLLPQIQHFFSKRIIIFLICAFLMLVSHGAYYAFFSIHLEKSGLGGTFIGAAWALASISEIVIMMQSDRILKRFAPEKVLVFAFLTAALRWFLLMFVRSPIMIMLLQGMHAFTYGAFHVASIIYIDMLSPKESKTLGQAVNNAATYGLGLMVGFFISGYIYDWQGAPAMFLISGLIALSAGVIFMNVELGSRN